MNLGSRTCLSTLLCVVLAAPAVTSLADGVKVKTKTDATAIPEDRGAAATWQML